MLSGKLKVTAVLVNPDGVWQDEIPAEFPDATYGRAAIHQLLATIRASGGLLREISENETQFIPMLRVKDINIAVEISTVGLASNLDMAKATSRIKL